MKYLAICLLFIIQSIYAGDFSYKNKYTDLYSGKEFSIDTKKENYVFMILNIDCPCFTPLFNHVEELSKKFKDYKFVGVHANNYKTADEISAFYKDHKISFPIVSDKDHAIADGIHANKTPHFVVLKNEKIEFSGGALDSRSLENAKKFYLQDVLEDLTNKKTPRWREAKTLGCILPR